MKVYVTKWNNEIWERYSTNAKPTDKGAVTVNKHNDKDRWYIYPPDYHLTLEAAQARVAEVNKGRIARLKAEIEKLEEEIRVGAPVKTGWMPKKGDE